MKISCSQLEGLLSFYLNNDLSENLKSAVEEHLKECSHCKMKYNLLSSIITDIKDAYRQIISVAEKNREAEASCSKVCSETITNNDLSAYIDNELSDEHNVRIRRKIVAKPSVRTKIERLYKLRKFLSNSFYEQKNRLKTDFSKEIVRSLNTNMKNKKTYIHCVGFICFVVFAVCFSIWLIFHIV